MSPDGEVLLNPLYDETTETQRFAQGHQLGNSRANPGTTSPPSTLVAFPSAFATPWPHQAASVASGMMEVVVWG